MPKSPVSKNPRAEMSTVPKCPRAETSTAPKCPHAEMSAVPKCPCAETSKVPKHPCAEMSPVPKCPCAEIALCRNVHVSKCPQCQNVHVPKRPRSRNVCAEMSIAKMLGAEMSPRHYLTNVFGIPDFTFFQKETFCFTHEVLQTKNLCYSPIQCLTLSDIKLCLNDLSLMLRAFLLT